MNSLKPFLSIILVIAAIMTAYAQDEVAPFAVEPNTQLDSGTYYFVGGMGYNTEMETQYLTDSSYYLRIEVLNDGSDLEFSLITLNTFDTEVGTGYYHSVKKDNSDRGDEGAEAYYQFGMDGICWYRFDAASDLEGTVEFKRIDCNSSGSLYLTRTSEEKAMHVYSAAMSEMSNMENYDIEDELDFVETDVIEFDYQWNNEGYDKLEKKLRRWLTTTGKQLEAAILKFQPTLSDCKIVFSDSDYVEAYVATAAAYEEMLSNSSDHLYEGEGFDYVRVQPLLLEESMLELHSSKGPFKLRSSLIDYYQFSFLISETNVYGRSMSFLVKIDGRYVLFPKG